MLRKHQQFYLNKKDQTPNYCLLFIIFLSNRLISLLKAFKYKYSQKLTEVLKAKTKKSLFILLTR